jgi:hypothetical protein
MTKCSSELASSCPWLYMGLTCKNIFSKEFLLLFYKSDKRAKVSNILTVRDNKNK